MGWKRFNYCAGAKIHGRIDIGMSIATEAVSNFHMAIAAVALRFQEQEKWKGSGNGDDL